METTIIYSFCLDNCTLKIVGKSRQLFIFQINCTFISTLQHTIQIIMENILEICTTVNSKSLRTKTQMRFDRITFFKSQGLHRNAYGDNARTMQTKEMNGTDKQRLFKTTRMNVTQ